MFVNASSIVFLESQIAGETATTVVEVVDMVTMVEAEGMVDVEEAEMMNDLFV